MPTKKAEEAKKFLEDMFSRESWYVDIEIEEKENQEILKVLSREENDNIRRAVPNRFNHFRTEICLVEDE